MAETPNPTNDEFYAALTQNVGRESAAQKEIVRRLELNMPDKITYLNGVLGYASGKGIPTPDSYGPAPSSALSDAYLNSILVSVAVSTSTNGVRTFKQSAQVVVYSVDRRIEHPTQVESYLDRAAVVTGILMCVMNDCIDAQGRLVWRILAPTGRSLTLPQGWGDGYSGSTAYFTLVQDQACNCWI